MADVVNTTKVKDWAGQSVIDKIVTFGCGVIGAGLSVKSFTMDTGKVQMLLMFLGALLVVSALVIWFVMRKSNAINNRLDEVVSKIKVIGYINRIRIGLSSGRPQFRSVGSMQGVDANAVERKAVFDWIQHENSNMTKDDIDALLDVYYDPVSPNQIR